GRSAYKRLQPVFYLGKSGGGMYHALFVPGHIKRKVRILVQCLPDSCHVSVSKNSQTARKKPILYPIPFHILIFQVFNCSLTYRKFLCSHFLCFIFTTT